VNVAVDVIAPVKVAALVSGNDAVALIDAVNEEAGDGGVRYRWHAALPGLDVYQRANGSLIVGRRRSPSRNLHDVVPVHERGHAHGSGNGQGHDHAHDQSWRY
jgi:hypothetical protein